MVVDGTIPTESEYQPVQVFSTEDFFKEDDIIKKSKPASWMIRGKNWILSFLKNELNSFCEWYPFNYFLGSILAKGNLMIWYAFQNYLENLHSFGQAIVPISKT